MQHAIIGRVRRPSGWTLSFAARGARTLVGAVLLASCGGSDSPTKATTPTIPTAPETPQVASVNLTPTTGQLLRTQTLQFIAVPVTAAGATVAGRTLQWTATPSTVASIAADGLLTALANGAATVTVTIDGKSASASVKVVDGAMVGASGGTVTTADGKVTLAFPAGALTESTPITIVPNTTAPTTPQHVAGTMYDIGPSRTFAQPVVLTMKYTPPANGAEPLVGLYSYEGGAWVLAPNSIVDTVAHAVTASVSHFSAWTACSFSCGGQTAGSDISFGNAGFELLQGQSHIVNGWYGVANYGGSLTCTLYDAPTGLTATVQLGAPDANRGGMGLATATFRATNTAAAGLYHMSIGCGGPGVVEHRGTVNVLVVANGFSFTVASSTLSVTQGATTTTGITITRLGTPGPVAFSTVSLPSGVTASFNPASVAGATTELTLTASADAPTGTFISSQVIGTASALAPISSPLIITVLPNGGFSLIGTPAFASVPVGGSGSTGVKAVRVSGFTAPISYAVSGLPVGLTATVSSTSVADSMRVAFTAGLAVTQGTYSAVVSGTASGKTQSVTIPVTVGPPGTAVVQIDLSACVAAGRTVWLAAQDGTAPFHRVAGSGNVYAFEITNGRGAVAAAINSATETEVFVNYGTPAELMARDFCRMATPDPLTRTLTVSAIGMTNSSDRVDLTMGGLHTTLQPALATQTLGFIRSGLLDFVAWKYNTVVAGQGVRGIIRRNQAIPNGGTAPPFDFTSSEAFLPASAPVSTSGVGGESGGAGLSYYIGAGCRAGYDLGLAQPFTSTLYGVPSSAMLPGELHGLSLSTPTRYAINYFAAMTSQAIALGASAPALAVTELGGPYRRRQVAMTLPADYSYAFYEYSDGGGHWASVAGNEGYFGGAAMTLAMPDLSSVEGFDPSWVPATGTSGRWNFRAATHASRPCGDGAKYREATSTGIN